jgi:hypothetical protein
VVLWVDWNNELSRLIDPPPEGVIKDDFQEPFADFEPIQHYFEGTDHERSFERESRLDVRIGFRLVFPFQVEARDRPPVVRSTSVGDLVGVLGEPPRELCVVLLK